MNRRPCLKRHRLPIRRRRNLRNLLLARPSASARSAAAPPAASPAFFVSAFFSAATLVSGSGTFRSHRQRRLHRHLHQHISAILLPPPDHVLPLRLLRLFLLLRLRLRRGKIQILPIRRPGKRMHVQLLACTAAELRRPPPRSPTAAPLSRCHSAPPRHRRLPRPAAPGPTQTPPTSRPDSIAAAARVPECVSGRSPPSAVHSHRSSLNPLCFQSGASVAITAADPPGARRTAGDVRRAHVLVQGDGRLCGLSGNQGNKAEGKAQHGPDRSQTHTRKYTRGPGPHAPVAVPPPTSASIRDAPPSPLPTASPPTAPHPDDSQSQAEGFAAAPAFPPGSSARFDTRLRLHLTSK